MGFFSRAKPRANDDDFSFRAAGAEADFGDDDPINAVRSYSGASPSGQIRGQTIGAQTTSLMVAVRCRPLLAEEHLRGVRKDIIRVMDERMIVVLDPDDEKNYLDQQQHRSKERRYTFDRAFGKTATNRDVYNATAKSLIEGVLSGHNGTVFAYGATGSGKTYTMVGEPDDPGMMLLSLVDIFDAVRRMSKDYVFEVTCSYLEVYNELIYDLLVQDSPSLDLRDTPERGATVQGLQRIEVKNTDNVMDLLREGNLRRKTEPTEANAVSSRSHAVLEINVSRRERARGYKSETVLGKLALVDLAGSERASETLNVGQKLRDGGNINRSLLALANCINALGKKNSGQGVYVPFRNSKLTRLLKDGLSGNSRTAMVANVSCGGDQYAHTINTLKYADRAKEIKTHVVQNLQTVESHISEYQRLIDNLQGEVAQLKSRLAAAEAAAPKGAAAQQQLAAAQQQREREQQMSRAAAGAAASAAAGAAANSQQNDNNRWLDRLCEELRENAEDRVDVQRALYEHEDDNIQNKCEMRALDDRMAELGVDPDAWGVGGARADALRDRRVALVRAIAENEAACLRYRTEMDVNERKSRALRAKTDAAAKEGRCPLRLARMLTRAREAEVNAAEANFQLDVRDSVISDQRELIGALWRILDATGTSREDAMATATREGIVATYDGTKESGLNGGIVDDGGGAEGNPLEARTVVGARAKARFDFWENYEHRPGATAGNAAAPPARVTPHGHAKEKERFITSAERRARDEKAKNAASGASGAARVTSPRRNRAGSAETRRGLDLAKKRAESRNSRGSAGSRPSSQGSDETGTGTGASSSRAGNSRGSSARDAAGARAGSAGSGSGAGSGAGAGAGAIAAGGSSSNGSVQSAAHKSAVYTRIAASLPADDLPASAAMGSRTATRVPTQGKRGGPPVSASGVHRAGAGLPSLQLGVSGSPAARTARPESGNGGGGMTSTTKRHPSPGKIASYASATDTAARLKALQMLRERHARAMSPPDTTNASANGHANARGKKQEPAVSPVAYVVARR